MEQTREQLMARAKKDGIKLNPNNIISIMKGWRTYEAVLEQRMKQRAMITPELSTNLHSRMTDLDKKHGVRRWCTDSNNNGNFAVQTYERSFDDASHTFRSRGERERGCAQAKWELNHGEYVPMGRVYSTEIGKNFRLGDNVNHYGNFYTVSGIYAIKSLFRINGKMAIKTAFIELKNKNRVIYVGLEDAEHVRRKGQMTITDTHQNHDYMDYDESPI